MRVLTIIIYTLILIVFGLIGFAIMQIRLAGMTVKDFWSFIEANKTLDKLYRLSKQYENMNPQQHF